MKNKFLMLGFLTLALIVSVTAYAAQTGSDSGTSNQTQTANQGEDTQVQVQTTQQAQTGTGTGAGTQTKQQIQQKLQDGSGDGEQVQNKNQEQVKAQDGTANATQRRSEVANAVQEMLQIADRNGGIGQQVRTIAQAQNQEQEKIEASLEKIQDRNGFAKFFIGPNYGEIKNAEKLMEQNQEKIQKLTELKNMVSLTDQQALGEQIKILEQANLQIQNQLNNASNGFSLLGWMFKLFK